MTTSKYVIGNNIELKFATIDDLDMIMNFQYLVISNMINKEYFCPLLKEEFKDALDNGVISLLWDGDILVGLAVLNCKPSLEVLEEYCLNDINDIGILDSVMIKEEYRGSKLQQQLVNYLDSVITKFNLKGVVATVHPDNIWSYNNLMACNYENINKIIIHGGERIILFKSYK